jgi:3-methyladenine DNA glycosylase AlkD
MKSKLDLNNIINEIEKSANKEKAESLHRFFKTGPGEYGEGDVFIGLNNADQKIIAQKFFNLSLKDLESLLKNKIHECRSTALSILVNQYQKGNQEKREKIFNLYLRNIKHINNWDLVDISSYKIIGNYLLDKPRDFLYQLSKAKDIWSRRISIISTFEFIRHNEFKDTFKIAEILINDSHDLIHKAVGWMLREVGKRDLAQEEKFLKKYYRLMPRTMLRYAIERFPNDKRIYYMKK